MKPGILCDNGSRAFPFVPGSTGTALPQVAVVDFGCLMGLGSGFVTGTHGVYLHELRRSGDTFEFEFRSTAPGLFNYALTFTRQEADDDYTTEHVEAHTIDGGAEGLPCEEGLIWSGYMVSGEMLLLSDAMPTDSTISGGVTVEIEPALIQNLAEASTGQGGAYVNTLNLANTNRTQISGAEGCRSPCFPADQEGDLIFTVVTCLTGKIRFAEGYNNFAGQNSTLGTLSLGAQVGAGAGEPCEEVPLFPAEVPPTGSNFYGGGPACNEVLRSINGVGGRMFTILAGQGARITPVPAQHKLIIDVDMHQLAVCHAETVSDTSCSDVDTYSDSSCTCGPE